MCFFRMRSRLFSTTNSGRQTRPWGMGIAWHGVAASEKGRGVTDCCNGTICLTRSMRHDHDRQRRIDQESESESGRRAFDRHNQHEEAGKRRSLP